MMSRTPSAPLLRCCWRWRCATSAANASGIAFRLSSSSSKASVEAVKEDKQLQTSFATKGKIQSQILNHIDAFMLAMNFSAKDNAKTAGYAGVIVGGVGVTCAILYLVFQEMFSGESPVALFQKAADQCTANEKVQSVLQWPNRRA